MRTQGRSTSFGPRTTKFRRWTASPRSPTLKRYICPTIRSLSGRSWRSSRPAPSLRTSCWSAIRSMTISRTRMLESKCSSTCPPTPIWSRSTTFSSNRESARRRGFSERHLAAAGHVAAHAAMASPGPTTANPSPGEGGALWNMPLLLSVYNYTGCSSCRLHTVQRARPPWDQPRSRTYKVPCKPADWGLSWRLWLLHHSLAPALLALGLAL
mmetsp:Transcript_18701/g.47324  ORF Transcript_18701/g.47324 Transcript_18701/m.47324 type:complete len:212 (-) Transcript_18701:230-865(-)